MEEGAAPDRVGGKREFDWSRYARRHVALLVSYLGWDYDGLVVQDNTDNTIEDHIYNALLRTKLIASRETAQMSKCGRTDKGVSSAFQVMGFHLRSNLREGKGVYVPDGHCSQPSTLPATELNYATILSRVLPKEIRVMAWAPVDLDFSARHSCNRRVYKYFFPRGSLELGRMREAAAFLVGPHDFRHFCKVDRRAPEKKTTERTVFDCRVEEQESGGGGGYSMAVLTVEGSGFLWHMIRCIVAVLLTVGEGHEEPDVVQRMLQIDQNKDKPQYALASELPLCLFHAEYDGVDLDWRWDQGGMAEYVKNLQQQWSEAQIKATMIREMLDRLPSLGFPPHPNLHHHILYPGLILRFSHKRLGVAMLKDHRRDSTDH